MSGTYLTDLRDVLVGAGCNVGEIDGWETRARGSGGYHAGVWVVMWHHTASAGDGYEDALYCALYSDVAPVCNVTIGQDGKVWLVAAGCTNTNGSGGPMTLPDGRTIPLDDCNRYAFGIEISNNGVGMPYPAAQMDAAFRVSNAIAARYISAHYTNASQHHDYAPSRKIDPATAAAVQGSWHPASTNSSGSWNLGDLRAELTARAGGRPPTPSTIATAEEEPMFYFIKPDNEDATTSTIWVSDMKHKWAARSNAGLKTYQDYQYVRLIGCGMDPDVAHGFAYDIAVVNHDQWIAMGLNIDPNTPGRDAWGWNPNGKG